MTMTIKIASEALAIAHIRLSNSGGKLRVNFHPGFEATARYCGSVEDAVTTGLSMSHARTMALIADLNASRHRWSIARR